MAIILIFGSWSPTYAEAPNTAVPQLDPSVVKIDQRNIGDISADLPQEPNYAETSKLWRDQKFIAECAVLGAKNSRAKFISFWNGAVGTLMYTDLASQRELTSLLPHSLLMVIGSGKKPDFRFHPDAVVKQSLLEGDLPCVISEWEHEGIKFKQTAVGRQIEGMEAKTGRENTVALIKVEMTNPQPSARRAEAWVGLLAGMNRVPLGSDRTMDQAPYLEPLRLADHDVVTSEGALRVSLDLPHGATVDSHLAPDYVPATWDREAKPRLMERPVVAFKGNNWLGGWWGLGSGPADLGAIWRKRVWVKGVRIFFDANTVKDYPVDKLAKVQTWVGNRWTDVPARVEHDAKVTDVITSREARVGYGGGQADGWTWSFEPVRSQRLRLVLREKALRINPVVQEMIITYNKNDEADKGKGEWITTRDGVAEQNALRIGLDLGPGETKSFCVKIPYLPAGDAEARKIKDFEFDAELEAVKKFWRAELALGMTLEIPEQRAQQAWNSSLIQMMISTDLDPIHKIHVARASVGWYEYVYGLIPAIQAEALDNAGYHDEAQKWLDAFLVWQGTMPPTGDFKSKEGFLTAGPDYSPGVFTSNNGYILHALCRHYLLTRDEAWLKTALPHILASVDWIQRERKQTLTLGAKGEKNIGYGLLPAGNGCDAGTIDQYWYNEVYTWQGLNEAAKLLHRIGHPRGGEIERAAGEYRQCILDALLKVTAAAPKLKLPGGEEIPFIPLGVHDKLSVQQCAGIYLDIGPAHLIESGVLPAESKLARWIMQATEAFCMRLGLSVFEPNYCPQRAYYLDRDQIHKFLLTFYSYLCVGLSPNLYSGVEEWKGIQLDQFTYGEYLRLVQMMLIRENQGRLLLGQAIPRPWLEEGKKIAVNNAKTGYGPVSFAIESHVAKGLIEATIDPPAWSAVPIQLRLRHPEQKPIRSVTVNGRAFQDFDVKTETIRLPADNKTLRVIAQY